MKKSKKIVFASSTPMNYIMFKPIADRMLADDRIDVWFTAKHSPKKLYGAVGVHNVKLIRHELAELKKFDMCICPGYFFKPKRTAVKVEMFHSVNDNQELTELGKNIPASSKQNAIGELAGISKFQRRFLKLVFSTAQKDFQNGKINHHYEECVFRTSKQAIPIHAVADKDLAWIEIDTAEDLQKAHERIYPLIKDKSQQK